MIICYSIGGLGNQMFQYALGNSLAKINHVDLRFDLRAYKNPKYHNPEGFLLGKLFDINIEQADAKDYTDVMGILEPLLRVKHRINLGRITKNFVQEKQLFHFNESILEKTPTNAYLHGSWQSYKYVELFEKDLREKFSLKRELISKQSIDFVSSLTDKNSVSIQVRLKDYVENSSTREIYNVCDDNYYRRCIDVIRQKVARPKFFVFSDDPEKAREIDIFKNFNIVDINKNSGSWNDLYLMSKCSHNIIANSTFGWWSAWLNNNKKKCVLTPETWFANGLETTDLIPPSWKKIKNR